MVNEARVAGRKHGRLGINMPQVLREKLDDEAFTAYLDAYDEGEAEACNDASRLVKG